MERTIDRALIISLATTSMLLCSAGKNATLGAPSASAAGNHSAKSGSTSAKRGSNSAKNSSNSAEGSANATELISRCQSLRRQNRAQEALVALDSAIASQPGNAELYNARSACYLDLGNLTKAEADVDLSVKHAKRSQVESYAKQYSSLSESYRKKLQPERMGAVLDKYVNATHSIDAYCARAQMLRTRGDITAALKDLDAAIALAPQESKALEQKALTAFKAKRFKEARDAYTSLIKIYSAQNPGVIHVYSGRGYCYNKFGEYEKAIADFNVAAKAGFDRRLLLARARAFEALGKFDKALIDADTIVKKEPNNNTAIDLRIAMLERLGKHEEALTQADAMIARYPSSANWYRRRAAIFKASGKEAQAKADLSKARKLESFID